MGRELREAVRSALEAVEKHMLAGGYTGKNLQHRMRGAHLLAMRLMGHPWLPRGSGFPGTGSAKRRRILHRAPGHRRGPGRAGAGGGERAAGGGAGGRAQDSTWGGGGKLPPTDNGGKTHDHVARAVGAGARTAGKLLALAEQ